jgi:hypothetical protein
MMRWIRLIGWVLVSLPATGGSASAGSDAIKSGLPAQ